MAAAAAVTRVVSVAAVTPLGRPSVAATATVVVAARMLDGRLLPSGIGSMTSSSMGLGIRNSFPLSHRFGVAFCRHQGCNVYLGLRTSIEAALQHATHTLRPVGTRVLPAGVDARGCADATGRRYNAVKALLALASHRDWSRRHALQQPKRTGGETVFRANKAPHTSQLRPAARRPPLLKEWTELGLHLPCNTPTLMSHARRRHARRRHAGIVMP